MVLKGRVGGDSDVVNIDTDRRAQEFMFQYNIVKDVVHHHLECGRGVGQPKEHHHWFEETVACFERALLLVTVLYAYIVVATTYIHLRVVLVATHYLVSPRDTRNWSDDGVLDKLEYSPLIERME